MLCGDSSDESDELDIEEYNHNFDLILSVKKKVEIRAKANINESQEKQKKNYDKRHSSNEMFKCGDKVLVRNLRREDRKGAGTNCHGKAHL